MIISINQKTYEAYPSQSISSFISEDKEYIWETTGENVNSEMAVWAAQDKYGNNWRWIERKPLKGGDDDSTGRWFSFVIGIIIWLIILLTGLVPFIAGYYAIAVENILNLLKNVFVWMLGPEDPFIYIVTRIVKFFGKIVTFVAMVVILWYFTALWCYAPYYSRYGECQANHMRKFFGGIIVVMFIFFYYSWGVGEAFLDGMRSLEGAFLIGPMMRFLANMGQKLYNKMRRPQGMPFFGPAIVAYFDSVELGMPYLMKALDPLEMAVEDTPGFLKMTQTGIVSEVARKFDVDKIFKFANYEYMTDEEKSGEFFDRGQKITSRFMKWNLITLCSIFGGGLGILRKVCADDEIKDLEKKLFEATIDKKMDERARRALVTKIQYQMEMAHRRPKINEQCLINKIETSTLAGFGTMFWGLIVFVIFLFFRPPSPN